MTVSTGLKVGLLSGLLFFAHAMVPGSHAWPLIWPVLGGLAAVYLRRGHARSFSDSVKASAKAGASAGAFFFLATAAALFLLSRPGWDGLARDLGAEAPIVVNAPILFALAVAAAIGVILATASGALAHPLVRRSNG